MNDILTVENPNKSYGDFSLTDVAFKENQWSGTTFRSESASVK